GDQGRCPDGVAQHGAPLPPSRSRRRPDRAAHCYERTDARGAFPASANPPRLDRTVIPRTRPASARGRAPIVARVAVITLPAASPGPPGGRRLVDLARDDSALCRLRPAPGRGGGAAAAIVP